MSDAFISYSRRDSEFVRRLAAALGERGKTVWLDVDDIAPASRWSDELKAAILQAEAFVFVMSPDSAASPECAKELEYAVALNKRIVPVHFEQTDVATLDIELATRNWIPQVGLFTDNFTDSVDTLIRAIETDLDWVHQHTLWLGKALEWEEHSDDASFLLRGSELDAAEQWLAGQAGKTPPATALHQRFVLESRRATVRRLRRTRAAVSGALVVALVLAGVALVQRNTAVANQRTARSRQLAAQAEVALSTDPEQGTGLAMQALKVKNTAQADAALRDALPRMQVLQTLNVGDRTNDAEFDHGGRTVVTASDNGTATLWDVGTGRRIKDLVPADHAALTTAVFDRAGTRVVTGGKDGITRLWSVPTCTVVKELKEPGGAEVTRATFNADGSRVLTADRDGKAIVWNVATGKPVSEIDNGAPIEDAEFSPNGRYVVTAGDGGTAVKVFLVATAKPRLLVRIAAGGPGSNTIVLSAKFSNDNTRVVTADDSGVHIWGSLTGDAIGDSLTNPVSEAFTDARFSPDGTTVVASSDDGLTRVWNPGTEPGNGQILSVLRGHSAFVEQASFNADGTRIVTASGDGTAKIWNPRPAELDAVLPSIAGVNRVAFAPDGTQIVAVGDLGVVLWNTATGALVRNLSADFGAQSVAYSPDGRTIITGNDDGTVQLLDPTATVQTPTVLIPAGPTGSTPATSSIVANVAFRPDGKAVLVTSLNGTARLVDLATGNTRLTIREPGHETLYDGEFSPDGNRFVTASGDGTARVYDAASGRRLAAFTEPDQNALRSAVFSHDGTRILTASVDGSARVWDTKTGRAVVVLHEPQASPLYDADFGAAGTKIVTASDDGTVRMWDAATGTQLAVLEVLDAVNTTHVYQAAFSPDATQIAAVTSDDNTRLWSSELSDRISDLERIAIRRLPRTFNLTAQSANQP